MLLVPAALFISTLLALAPGLHAASSTSYNVSGKNVQSSKHASTKQKVVGTKNFVAPKNTNTNRVLAGFSPGCPNGYQRQSIYCFSETEIRVRCIIPNTHMSSTFRHPCPANSICVDQLTSDRRQVATCLGHDDFAKFAIGKTQHNEESCHDVTYSAPAQHLRIEAQAFGLNSKEPVNIDSMFVSSIYHSTTNYKNTNRVATSISNYKAKTHVRTCVQTHIPIDVIVSIIF